MMTFSCVNVSSVGFIQNETVDSVNTPSVVVSIPSSWLPDNTNVVSPSKVIEASPVAVSLESRSSVT